MTFGEMCTFIADACRENDVSIPSYGRITMALNAAKDEVVQHIEMTSDGPFTYRKDYTVASGDAGIAIPTADSGDKDFRSLVTLKRTDLSYPVDVHIVDIREIEKWAPLSSTNIIPGWTNDSTGYQPIMYYENNAFRFINTDGAPAAMTLRMRYKGKVPDLQARDRESPSTRYEDMPSEWDILIVYRAASLVAPKASSMATGFLQDFVDGVTRMKVAFGNRTETAIPNIKWM